MNVQDCVLVCGEKQNCLENISRVKISWELKFVLVVCVSCLSFFNLLYNIFFLCLPFPGVFYLLSSMAVTGALFCYYLLPETKGKSLEAIEILFMKDKKKLGSEEQQDLRDQY